LIKGFNVKKTAKKGLANLSLECHALKDFNEVKALNQRQSLGWSAV